MRRVVGFLEQQMLLLQADQACTETVIGARALGGLAEIEIGEAYAELLQGLFRATARNGREASTA
jgi:hypothetical protein